MCNFSVCMLSHKQKIFFFIVQQKPILYSFSKHFASCSLTPIINEKSYQKKKETSSLEITQGTGYLANNCPVCQVLLMLI